MPYLVYKIFAEKKLEYVDSQPSYREAKAVVNAMRKELPKDADHTVRLVFAKNQDEAERLLTEEREAPPAGEEYN
ncbi:hypothetical protein [Endothiovibrio diazotrophicus]